MLMWMKHMASGAQIVRFEYRLLYWTPHDGFVGSQLFVAHITRRDGASVCIGCMTYIL
jgi:hypothetical protein